MFKKSFSFKGRIRRTEYGISFIIYVVGLAILEIPFTNEANPGDVSPIFFILAIPAIWFMIAQGAKRCHDRGNSGWYQLIPFYECWMLFADSDNGNNAYGPNPKGIGNIDEIDEIGQHLTQ
ncbi:hypothetical protein BH11BAC5_BH11BAC5_09990 [soil metagenome]